MSGNCSVCGKAVAGSDVMYTTDAQIVCPTCSPMATLPKARPAGMGAVIAGAIAGALPFVISTTSSSVSTVNGRIVEATYRDFGAILGGAVASACGIAAIVVATRAKARRTIGLGVLVLALGGLQLARGVGVFQPGVGSEASGPYLSRSSIDFPTPTRTPTKAPTPATCANGNECFDLGEALFEKDPANAGIAYMRACDFKITGGCANAAIALRGQPDPARDVQLYTKGCALGSKGSCANLGVSYLIGNGVTEDLPRGRELLSKACEDNDPTGCRNMAIVFRDGVGGPPDHAEALRYSIKACDIGGEEEANSCSDAGAFLLLADKPDEKRAVTFLEKGCERADRQCNNLGSVTEDGLGGVKKDVVAARALYEKSCNGGLPLGCKNLARMFEDGLGGPKDADRARALYKQACDGGENTACDKTP